LLQGMDRPLPTIRQPGIDQCNAKPGHQFRLIAVPVEASMMVSCDEAATGGRLNP